MLLYAPKEQLLVRCIQEAYSMHTVKFPVC